MNQKMVDFIKKHKMLFKIANFANDFFKSLKFWVINILKTPKKIFYKISKKNDIVEELLLDYPMINSGMMSKDHIRVILKNLKKVLEKDIEGDIVELGCNVGTTSLFIRKMLNKYKSKKKFHIYDSFEGLPDISKKDEAKTDRKYRKGDCKTSKDVFINNFNKFNLELPIMNKGFFSQIPDKKYPEKIAFAFFDGDFYSSILDSFKKTYPKLSKGAIVAIHDYKRKILPGVEKACNEFLEKKPEKGTIINYDGIGVMIKK